MTLKNSVILFLLVSLLVSCTKSPMLSPNGVAMYSWEAERKNLVEIDDLVLLYSGGAHRSYQWNNDLVSSYITYTDRTGQEHWLFDGFLFLEIFDLVNKKKYATGYAGEAALKEDWKALIDLYFKDGYGVKAIEQTVEDTKKRLGTPNHKHRVVISIPEPIASVSNFGEVNGVNLDFTKSDEERMKAVKWYIDYARECFEKGNFKNVELAGFYWVAETATHTRSIISQVAHYLNDLNYSFNWIPYWNSDGYKDWKKVDFNFAYLQPNYSFNDKIEYSRLDEACEAAIKYDMDMEVEFDETALVAGGDRGYRLSDYLKAFREHKIIETKRLAYYQGGNSVDKLKKSSNEADQKLYHEFCQFVIDHRAYMGKKNNENK